MANLQFQILMECAKAIEGGNLDVADSLLESIQSLASEQASNSTRKVVKYCAEALVRRAYGIRPLCPLRSPTFLFEPVKDMCFLEFAKRTTTEHAIADAFNPTNKHLHIIDLSIISGISRWTFLIDNLIGRFDGLQSVLITIVTPKLSNHSDQSSQEWGEMVQDVYLEWRQLIYNSPHDIVKCFSKLGRKRKDEMVVVNWDFTIRNLLAQDGAIEQVLSKVRDLKADIMVISEQEADLNSPDLSERLKQSLQYYSTIFESLEQDNDTFMSRETYFRRQIGNVVACDGIDRIERIASFDQWQHRLSQAGFRPVPLQEIHSICVLILSLKGFRIEQNDGRIELRWRGFPLAVASVWKLTDPPQSSSGLGVMQDIVDDPEQMASSSESEDDEENDPCIMADRNLWSTQGSSMNRIAASAKLFDILEYICHLHKLPVAVTWISYNRGWNANSNEKRTLCIDYSACYTLIRSMDEYVGGYAHHRLEEGQGIAGKAFQSNIHIQHDIYMLDPIDFPDNRRVWKNRTFHASFAIRLTSNHSCKDDYVLEFFLPEDMEDISERELLISKVLHTLQENCLESWKVWVRELNEASGSGVRLDDERMSNIPHEAVLGGNEFMTFNPASNQAGQTREPLQQDIQEQSGIVAPALNDENASLIVDGGLGGDTRPTPQTTRVYGRRRHRMTQPVTLWLGD